MEIRKRKKKNGRQKGFAHRQARTSSLFRISAASLCDVKECHLDQARRFPLGGERETEWERRDHRSACASCRVREFYPALSPKSLSPVSNCPPNLHGENTSYRAWLR